MNIDFMEVFKTTSQTIEERFGKPIQIDSDFNGRKYNLLNVSSFINLKKEINAVTWNIK